MDGVVVLGTVAESSSSTSTNTAVSTTTTTATVASGTWRCRIFDTASPLRIPKADRHQSGWVDRRVRPADAPGGPRPGRPRPVVLTKENGGWAGEGRYGSFKARHRLPRSGDKFFGGTSCSGARTGPPRWWSRPASSGPHRSTTSTDAARGVYHIGMPTGVSLSVWLPAERAKWLEIGRLSAPAQYAPGSGSDLPHWPHIGHAIC